MNYAQEMLSELNLSNPQKKHKKWKRARVEGKVDIRSYQICTENGHIYRRNRSHLVQTDKENCNRSTAGQAAAPGTAKGKYSGRDEASKSSSGRDEASKSSSGRGEASKSSSGRDEASKSSSGRGEASKSSGGRQSGTKCGNADREYYAVLPD